MSTKSKATAPITREHSGPEGAELDVEAGRKAARLAALNVRLLRGSIWDRSPK